MSLFRLPLMLLTLHSVWLTLPISLVTRGAAPYLPKNYWDAIKQPDYKEQWYLALSAQVKSLEDNETWELVKLPPGEVALGGQWILNQRKGYG